MEDSTHTASMEYPKFIKAFTVLSKTDFDKDYFLVKIRINIMHISSYCEAPEIEIDGITYQVTTVNIGGHSRYITLPIDALDRMIENTEIKFKETANDIPN